ncbi:MAG: HIT family protein [Prevotella sp.]|jgi:histidine triad (HIT) family protein|nr:HIT family protein [Prevotella sp.]
MASIFSKIVKSEIPSYKIYEDDRFYSFLDINPMSKGHVLVIPKQEIDYIFDLNDALLADMFVVSKRIAAAIEQAVPCRRVGLMVVGLEVPHAHIHLIPIVKESDMNLSNPKLKLAPAEFEQIAQDIRAKL